jgi:outer membrane protein assembly factor BamB
VTLKTVVLVTALALLAASHPAAQSASLDYPEWRGQNRDGSASGFIEPAVWPDRLTLKWRVEVGEGYATPLIVNSTVYAFVRRQGDELLLALDADSGRERWRTAYPARFTPPQPAAAHGAGPKATPLFHRNKVFTLGISGILSAFDATSGKLLWQTSPPAEPPFFSAASSPVGHERLVIAHPGNYGPLTAFDIDTGAIEWTAGGNGFYASPVVVELAGMRQVVSVLPDSVIGVSPTDGAILWRQPWAGVSGSVTPILYRDTIIVSGQGAGVMAIRPVRQDGRWTVEQIWQTSDVSMYVSTPVVTRGMLFGLSHRNSGQLFALDAATGKMLWLGEPRTAANTAIAKTADLVFFLNDNAELIVARASGERFEPIRRYTVAASATWAQPAISGSRILVKDAASLTLWTIE